MTVHRVGANGVALTDRTDVSQSGIEAGTQVVVTTGTGALTVSSTVTAAGNLLLSAAGDPGIDAAVTSTAGVIELAAGGDLLQDADVQAQGAGKTITLRAVGDL
ncbi:hypothetical protein HK414_15930 [Ramlibacter terrae]|uniref:Uncharacterized protein n=1 Tax=Ramlibacter terrae TaxID=2732511 RepID=A0ABX6P3I2_9BURK|nr:hypothetical protein HK414_15930 [Ramlibacter terrae]